MAGKRKGFEDTRGTLFFEIARIAKEKRPKALLLENVKGLVNHDKGRTLDIMIKTLNEIGYVVDFEVLNSKYFGVPQNRERIFIVAIREDLIEQEPWIIKGNTIVPKGKRRISEYEWAKTFNFDWPEQTEVTTRLRDILESDVDEKYYLDEEKTKKLLAELEKQKAVMGGGHREPKVAEEVRPVLTPNRLNKRQNGRRFKEDGEEMFTLTALDRHGVVLGNPPKYRIRELTPRECWRLQGFPDEAHDAVMSAGISDNQRYKQAGNAVTVNVVEAIGERLIPMLNESKI